MKNKKTIATLLLMLFAFIYSPAQLNVFWGKENPLEKGQLPAIIVKRGSNLLASFNTFRGIDIVKYSYNDLLLQKKNTIIGNSKKFKDAIDNDYSWNDYIILKNKTFVAVTKYDKKADLNSYYVQEISNEGALTGPFTKLADISAKSKRNTGAFDVYPSMDSTKILIVSNPPYEKYNKEKFGFKIYDEKLKQTHNLEVTLPYLDKYFSVTNYELSKDGNIYALVKIDLPRKEKEKDEADYYYEIIAINPNNSGQVTEYEIKLPQKYIMDISFRQEGKSIICAGLYNTIETKGRNHEDINGIFYLRINKADKSIEATGLKELDKDFIAELTNNRRAKKGRGVNSTFELKQLIQKEDGGLILVSENAFDYIVTRCTTDPKTGVQTCHTEHHWVRNNIIAINIDPKGAIKWYVNIPKFQHTVNDGGIYSSYMISTGTNNNVLTASKNKIYIIYNDNPANLDPAKVKTSKDIKPMKRVTKTVATLVTLTEDGKYAKQVVFNNKDNNKMVLLPDYYRQMEDGQLIAPVVKVKTLFSKGKYKFARFEFK